MKKLIGLLAFVFMFVVVGTAYSGLLDSKPERYWKQSVNPDGNILYLDKNSIRHYTDDMTKYTGIIELNPGSDLYKTACEQIKSTQEPVFVATLMTMDCTKKRFNSTMITIFGYEKSDKKKLIVLWQQDFDGTDWQELPNGLEKNAKALLCGQSF